MTLYFDTSIFVPLTVSEQKTQAVQDWFAQQNEAELLFSEWGITEFHSAISLKLRTGQINEKVRLGALDLFKMYSRDYFEILFVRAPQFKRASELAANADLKLRAGDALHLAIAERAQAKLCTLDKALFNAAGKIGVEAYIV